jgi:hypothetical protein
MASIETTNTLSAPGTITRKTTNCMGDTGSGLTWVGKGFLRKVGTKTAEATWKNGFSV